MSQIKRKKRKDNYSIIPNDAINDKRISFKAKGLLIYLLSKPDDWQTYIIQLSKVGNDGKDSVRSGIDELMKAGYVTREKLRNEKGKFSGYDYTVSDEPTTDLPYADNPTTDLPTTENPQLLRTDSNKELNKKTKEEKENSPSFVLENREKVNKINENSISFGSSEDMLKALTERVEKLNEYLKSASKPWRNMTPYMREKYIKEFCGSEYIKSYGNYKEHWFNAILIHMRNKLNYNDKRQ